MVVSHYLCTKQGTHIFETQNAEKKNNKIDKKCPFRVLHSPLLSTIFCLFVYFAYYAAMPPHI